MTLMEFEARHGLRYGFGYGLLGLAAIGAVFFISSDAADARHHRIRVHYAHHSGHVHHRSAEAYAPPSSSIVVDGNTGQVLQESNADAARHPASLTKIMTLYLLFERLDAGKIKLDGSLKVSSHAADQDPTKLDLKPGSTIMVEDAIKGIVTRSANDAAVVVAENIGGSEDDFARMMTQKARALGMSRTTYVNASGLPNDDQITTARDQALLGRAIQERFPRYYKYFSLPSFVYHGEAIRNHDHLLGQVEGVDGIKTGFTRASGFNLVTSLHRDGRYIVAVVLGGRSGGERDAHMRELINAHVKEASLHRTTPVIAEQTPQHDEPAFAKASLAARAEPATTATVSPRTTAANDPLQPLLVKTVTYRIAPVQAAPLAPMPALVPVAAPAPRQAAAPAAAEFPHNVVASAAPMTVIVGTKSDPIKVEPAKADPARSDANADTAKPSIAKYEPAPTPQAHPRGAWLVQIGAFDGEDEAKQHLTAAQSKARDILGSADPFTERVKKGDKALYRARFAGFDKATADAICKQLKQDDFECMTVKN